ncbi:MAG: YciK family oxidoreductase [Cellvibrionales bacterium]|nr:YciK family oxidoreductase [Cellvibrionales bacterium]
MKTTRNLPATHHEIFAADYSANYLAGRTVLVTGAGDGIGQTAALHYAVHGARLILAGRTVAKLENTYDQILANNAPQPSIYPIDFAGAQEADYTQMAAHIDKNGPLNGILFNASLLGARCPIENYPLADWDACMTVNLRSQFLMTKALLPALQRHPDSKIIYTSSGVGRHGRAHWGAYAISKFATEGLMQVLADELDGASSLCVNAINPGPIRTQMRATAYPAENPTQLPTATTIMPLYLYLIGPASANLSGHSLDAQP